MGGILWAEIVLKAEKKLNFSFCFSKKVFLLKFYFSQNKLKESLLKVFLTIAGNGTARLAWF